MKGKADKLLTSVCIISRKNLTLLHLGYLGVF